MPSLLELLTTYLPDTLIGVVGIVLAAVMIRRRPVAAILAILGCLCWLAQGVLVFVTYKIVSVPLAVIYDVMFAAGMALLVAAALVGTRRPRKTRPTARPSQLEWHQPPRS